MPIPKLNITDELEGLPRQPVPLRYAVLVTGLPVKNFVAMLANSIFDSSIPPFPLLAAYTNSGEKTNRCPARRFNSLREQMAQLPSENECMKQLPANLLVYSDELAVAFYELIKITGPENYDPGEMVLDWDPHLHPHEAEIEACPPIYVPSSELSRGELRKQQTAQKHQAWYNEYSQIKNQHPTFSDSHIATLIAKKHSEEKTTVRRVISDMKNS